MPVIHTIGYEGSDADAVMAALAGAGIELLADIRALPLSRKAGFSKSGLAARLQEGGINYLHLRALGAPKPARDAAHSGDRDTFLRLYLGSFETAPAQSALADLADRARQQRTCLLCFEREPSVCHRTIVAHSLEKLGFESVHLYAGPPPA